MPLTFGSCFSGFGGMDLGFENAGLRCAWQVENNSYAQRVLEKNFPGVRRHDDIRTFQPDESWRVDIVCFGDPCQGNSNAGSIHKTEHADLGSEAIRVVRLLRPRVVVRENPTVMRPDALWTWQRMRSVLGDLGYVVLPFRLRACCLGLDHRRDRLFLLAELPDANSKRLEGVNWQGFAARDVGRTNCNRIGIERDRQPASRVCRGADGIPSRMERLVGLGNAVPPIVAYWIARRIIEATGEPT